MPKGGEPLPLEPKHNCSILNDQLGINLKLESGIKYPTVMNNSKTEATSICLAIH